MTAARGSELSAICKLGEELAKGRGERATTGHMLAAIASGADVAAELLKERRLGAEVLLKAARVLTDDHTDAVSRAMQRARELAARCPVREASAVHLLFSLCQERSTAAYRTIAQCGSDVAKLRTAAMQAALGIVGARRPPQATQLSLQPSAQLVRTEVRASSPAVQPIVTKRPAAPPAPTLPTARGKRYRLASPDTPQTAGGTQHRFELDAKRFPALTAIGKNLTLAASRGELDPVFGRETEIERTLDVLAKRHANCPCLLGPSGVGKTSVVRGLAQRIADGREVALFDDRIVIEVQASALVCGTGVRGALAEKMSQLRAELVKAERRVVLFFDELHAILSSDDEAATELKSAIAGGEIACIGATTPEEHKRLVGADAALGRRLTVIDVSELAPDEATRALERVAPLFERHHGVKFSRDAISSAVSWTARYVPDRPLPEKAVGLLDLAGARARRRGEREVGRAQVADVLSEVAGVPVDRLLETDGARMLRLEQLLGEHVVGHGHALARIAHVLRRNAGGFRSQRPIGSFLLLGPTGVGKTETAKAVAECLFYSPHAMTRLDFSEYAEAHAVARLVGAPPGYIGHEAGGQLTEAVRRRPYQVLLLDEIEKAHRDVLEAFLQVFDEGRMTDGRGRTVDFTNVVVVMTSNLGSNVARPTAARKPIGFGARDGRETRAYTDALCASARSELPAEFYNRIDEVIAFAPLDRSEVAQVARRLLAGFDAELTRGRGVRLDVSDSAIEALLDRGGFDAELGARPMRRAIARFVEAPIAEMILRGELADGDVAVVDGEGGEIAVHAVRAGAAAANGTGR